VFLPFMLSLSTAHAHPFSPTAWAMRTSVVVEGETLGVRVLLEAPTTIVLKEIAAAAGALDGKFNRAQLDHQVDLYNDKQWATLGDGMRLVVNGVERPLSWAPADTPINGRASEKFFVYIVQAKWPVAATAPLEVEIYNEAFPSIPMYLTVATDARDGWVVGSETEALLRGGVCLMDEVGDDADQPEDATEIDKKTGEVWVRDDSLRRLIAVFDRDAR
jgi:hypothetical protein